MVAGIAEDSRFGHKPPAGLSNNLREARMPRRKFKEADASAMDRTLEAESKRNYFWKYAEILIPRGFTVTMYDPTPSEPYGRMRASCSCRKREFTDRFKHAEIHSERCPAALAVSHRSDYETSRPLPQSADAYRDKLNRLVPKRDGVTSLADINSKLDALAEIVIDLAKGRQQQ